MVGMQGTDAAVAGLAFATYDEALQQEQFANSEKAPASYGSPKRSDSFEASTAAIASDAPTEEDKVNLRRVPAPIPIASFLIGFIELAERFSYYGSTVVFTNFIQQKLPAGSTTGSSTANQVSGALGKGQRAATGLTTFNSFWVYVTPLFGAYIADTYLGRYKTICWAVVVALIGHVILTVSAIPSVIAKPDTSLGIFVVAIIIMGIGTGAFKSNISPLIAEQSAVGPLRVETRKNGERVLVDPILTASRVYMYFYLSVNVGALVGQIGMVYAEKRVGFWLSYLLPTLVFLFCPVILWIGRNRYIKTPPNGSVLSKSVRVIRFAGRGKWTQPKRLTANDFWDAAKPSNIPVEQRPGWMTFDDAYIDELRRGLKACKVFVWYPIWWLTYNQCNNNLVSQAATMQTHGLPNDILSNLDPFALLILIPVCDLLVYPALRRYGIRFTPIKRITAGFLIGALAMLCAAIVQWQIYKQSPCGYQAATCEEFAPINVWAQTPSYVFIALSEIFASITGLEIAYTKAPKSMRSLVTAVFLFTSAISSALGEAFLALSSDPLLIWNYGVMGALSFVAGIGFFFSFRELDADEERLNDLPEGHVSQKYTEKELQAERS
ncbi:POT family proton-dependent oligopeptide transporter [Microbotryum lychnidis-dioicae p1A1 Lamole]|uniref:POT family proton-dependent oligopeptide transporter n=1 Tax=Microbotryum lychnidis-dioicae (strain p1A1 Lamole / MvSl-1064) TaxID=683840 RepID=U5H9E5_USTV1|nr:POT family proton-dependent oligopeptide transporter [Microbotryum lychnidis-dioicae p1A1 Lamole]|eukprot:KDE05745.1 POT family proton-dependent oligopeptide transporter [Microbotryum lychnidis-dioicae p1A1 Lamole]